MEVSRGGASLPTLAASIVVCGAIVLCAGIAQGTDALPDQVAQALKHNAEALTGLEITGYYEHELLGDRAESLKQLAPLMSQAEFCRRCTFRLKLDGKRVHLQAKYPPSKFNSPNSVDERSFDGKKLYSGTAHPSGETRGMLVLHTPKTLVEDEKASRSWGAIFDLKYLRAAGFEGFKNSAELGQPWRSRVTDLVSHGELLRRGSVQRDGKAFEVIEIRYPEPWMSKSHTDVETDPNFVFVGKSQELQRGIEKERRTLVGETRTARITLDPAMNYAVVRVEEFRGASGAPMFVTENSDFVELQAGLWLPQACLTDGYAIGLRPKFTSKTALYRTKVKIDKIEQVEFSDKDFQVWFDLPGLNVMDYTHASAGPNRPYTYRVPEDIRKLKTSNGRFFWVAINIVVFIALAALIAWRVSRKRRGAT